MQRSTGKPSCHVVPIESRGCQERGQVERLGRGLRCIVGLRGGQQRCEGDAGQVQVDVDQTVDRSHLQSTREGCIRQLGLIESPMNTSLKMMRLSVARFAAL